MNKIFLNLGIALYPVRYIKKLKNIIDTIYILNVSCYDHQWDMGHIGFDGNYNYAIVILTRKFQIN